jgi:predicted transcriptional regulator
MEKGKLDLENRLLDYIKNHPNSSSREIHEGLGNVVAFATIKRSITTLLDKNFVATIGRGKSTKYLIDTGDIDNAKIFS